MPEASEMTEGQQMIKPETHAESRQQLDELQLSPSFFEDLAHIPDFSFWDSNCDIATDLHDNDFLHPNESVSELELDRGSEHAELGLTEPATILANTIDDRTDDQHVCYNPYDQLFNDAYGGLSDVEKQQQMPTGTDFPTATGLALPNDEPKMDAFDAADTAFAKDYYENALPPRRYGESVLPDVSEDSHNQTINPLHDVEHHYGLGVDNFDFHTNDEDRATLDQHNSIGVHQRQALQTTFPAAILCQDQKAESEELSLESPQNAHPDAIELQFQTFGEAESARYNNDVAPFQTLLNQTICDEEQQRYYVCEMVRAMKDLSIAKDNQGMIDMWAKLMRDEEALELAAWEVLGLCIRAHLQTNPLARGGKVNREYGTFVERVKDVCQALLDQKTICKHLVAAPYACSFVDNPLGAANRVVNNRKVNKVKKEALAKGRKALAEANDGEDEERPSISKAGGLDVHTQALGRRNQTWPSPGLVQIQPTTLTSKNTVQASRSHPSPDSRSIRAKVPQEGQHAINPPKARKRKLSETQPDSEAELRGTRKMAKKSKYPVIKTADGSYIIETLLSPPLIAQRRRVADPGHLLPRNTQVPPFNLPQNQLYAQSALKSLDGLTNIQEQAPIVWSSGHAVSNQPPRSALPTTTCCPSRAPRTGPYGNVARQELDIQAQERINRLYPNEEVHVRHPLFEDDGLFDL